MERHQHLGTLILSVGAIVLIAGHGIVLFLAYSHMAMSAAAVSGVIALVVLKHVGLLGAFYAPFRRRFRRDAR